MLFWLGWKNPAAAAASRANSIASAATTLHRPDYRDVAAFFFVQYAVTTTARAIAAAPAVSALDHAVLPTIPAKHHELLSTTPRTW